MALLKWIVIALLALVAVTVLAGQLGLLSGQTPHDLGVKDGRLKPPSNTENSASSQAGLYPDHPMRAYAEVAPLALAYERRLLEGLREDELAALDRLLDLMEERELATREG